MGAVMPSGFYNMDCMDAMKQFPDKFFELAIVDPPYGVKGLESNPTSRLCKYGQLNTVNNYMPNKDYFDELVRVSKNQIIWGYNHFADMLPATSEFIFWNKHQPVESYSAGELAYTSFNKTAKVFDYPYFGSVGMDKDGRIHPTQKPIALYSWLLLKYATCGDRILDTHVGSASSLIACQRLGFEYWGYELDLEYYEKAKERLDKERSQINLFAIMPEKKAEQVSIL